MPLALLALSLGLGAVEVPLVEDVLSDLAARRLVEPINTDSWRRT
jgi:hypothetical protein